ncbi:MarR family winged helix-turn-helix transcriptional regulator [Actinomyces marmotae]|uniref:MarR family transcriptional regulator n=1 Tax=Actinomyces marmotae TaxID=2737173 RepID=A0A6M8B6W0_9ACTO|nr:MarR family transcriptional regulator [Actinomyces marmotae]QKD79151.1 MarR family transcriptional regulator [Actinomyces marmotae]
MPRKDGGALAELDGPACGRAPASTPSCGQGPADGAPIRAASGCGAAGSPRLDALEMRAWRAFLHTATAVTGALNHELETGVGLSLHEYEILVRLDEAAGKELRMSGLAEMIGHSRSRLTHTVTRLEKEGYVERRSCPSDKRGVNCALTDSGLAFLRSAAPLHLDGVRRHVIDRLGRGDLEALAEIMSRLNPAH